LSLRVTGGTMRGRALVEPPDMRVRPTSDKVRQAIFNLLAHNEHGIALDGARVIDLFAGTGALAVEALSRGGAFALLVDESAESRALIRRNVEALNLTGVTKIWRRDATALGPMAAGAGGPFDLAFLDAPYRQELSGRALASLVAGGWLAAGAVVVAETGEDEALDLPPGLIAHERRVYGETALHILGASSD
jgi:16S rRNA (guanine966-N2)-methyltransferase